jgi:HD-GYP domain-containing protein (c-di-GMP phosphodiesterase class II)
VEAAAEEIRRGAGTQFDPRVVEAFDSLGGAAWAPMEG